MGHGVKIHNGVDLTYGYKLSIGDGAVIHQGVLLHDRGGITIGKNAVIGSFARIFSHSYSNDGKGDVSCSRPPLATAPASAATRSSWAAPTSAPAKSSVTIRHTRCRRRPRRDCRRHANLSFPNPGSVWCSLPNLQ